MILFDSEARVLRWEALWVREYGFVPVDLARAMARGGPTELAATWEGVIARAVHADEARKMCSGPR